MVLRAAPLRSPPALPAGWVVRICFSRRAARQWPTSWGTPVRADPSYRSMPRGAIVCQGEPCGEPEAGGGSGTSRPETTLGSVVEPKPHSIATPGRRRAEKPLKPQRPQGNGEILRLQFGMLLHAFGGYPI